MSTYLGWDVVVMSSDLKWPKSVEAVDTSIVGANTNPYTAQQQTQDWQARWCEISVSYAALTQAQGEAIVAFLRSLNGMLKVFQFPAGFCAAFPSILTTDGSTPRYWRLKSNATKWSVGLGPVYSITYELREAK